MAVLGYAILNVMRLNAARLNFGPSTVYVTITGGAAGAGAGLRARVIGALIRDVINATPASLTIRVSDTIPPQVPAVVIPQPGQEIRIARGTTAPQSAIFAGTILRRMEVKEGAPTNPPAFDLEGTDFSWLLDRRLAFGIYATQAADAIVADLMTRYAPGFTINGLERGLPAIAITFTGEPISTALSDIANRIGAKWKLLARDLQFFRSAIKLSPADPITPATCETFDAALDLAQVRTRVYVRGVAVLLTAAAGAGATSLQVADVTPFLAPGSGTVISEDGQVVSYASVQAAGYAPGVPPGSGPIVAPPPAPVPIAAADPPAVGVSFVSYTANAAFIRCVTTAAHGFAVGSFVAFAGNIMMNLGTVSAIVSATEFQIAVTPVAGGWTQNGGTVRLATSITAIRARQGVATLTTATPHNLAAGVTITIPICGVAAFVGRWTIGTVPSATTATFSISGNPADATIGALFRSTAGPLVGDFWWQTTYASDTAETAAGPSGYLNLTAVDPIDLTGWTFTLQDLGGSVETINKGLYPQQNYWYVVTAVDSAGHETQLGASKQINTTTVPTTINAQRVNWSIPADAIRDARIVAINVWRSPLLASAPTNPSQYGFVGTITIPPAGGALTYGDEIRDSARGGPPPTANTTGGAAIVTAIATGDPRVSARRIYRYQGPTTPVVYRRVNEISDNLTTTWLDTVPAGQPAAGVPAPGQQTGTFGAPGQLLGVPASGAGAVKVGLLTGASVALWVQRDDTAAQAALATLEGGDGVHESRIDDETITTIATANAAGDADLAAFKAAELKVRLTARDPKLQAGASVPIAMPAPWNVTATLVVQSVTISQLGIAGPLEPLRTVEAGTTWYQLQDLLRRVITDRG